MLKQGMQVTPTFVLLAAQSSALEKLGEIPFQTWVNVGLCILAGLIVARIWKGLREVGDFMPWLAVIIAGAMILSYWTYNRNEPRFLTPVVDRLTLLLPTKAKHAQDLEKWRKSRE